MTQLKKSAIFFLLIAVCIAASGTEQSAESQYVSRSDLVWSLQTENIDGIVESFNQIKRMHYQGELLRFIYALWSQDIDNFPDLPQSMIVNDRVRIEIADVLAQADRNGLIDAVDEEMHDYVRDLAQSSDKELVRRAVDVLGTIDDPLDVTLIYSIAREEAKWTFRSAILSLARMCSSEAALALDELMNQVVDEDNQQFMVETRQRMRQFKERANLCADRL